MIRIILTGLDFDVLLPITDITGRQAYFSLITSNSYSPAPAGHTRAVCMYVNVYPCVNAFFFPFFFFGVPCVAGHIYYMPVCVWPCRCILVSCKMSREICSFQTEACGMSAFVLRPHFNLILSDISS